MELGLSLGESPARSPPGRPAGRPGAGLDLSFSMGLSVRREDDDGSSDGRSSGEPPVQLDLLPLLPGSHRSASLHLGFPSQSEAVNRGLDVNRMPSTELMVEGEEGSSPNSAVSSFQMEFGAGGGGGDGGGEADEEENGMGRKKLRLSKEQSAFLEESFKEHNTLNPKEKLALAKQLNLHPRQVEVWFQNRRARTKLKQTEVDCEYLKRCCETLTEENRRLHKELSELRALKTAHPFYMQPPATTLSMCPSCERVSSSTAAASGGGGQHGSNGKPASFAALLAKPRFFPFGQHPAAAAPPNQPSAAS